MSRSAQNRPLKFGERDRREFIVENSEVSLIAINDDTGAPTYLGRAKSGTLLSEDRWQIRKITYDSNGGVTRVEWPQNEEGNASTEYEFVWDGDIVLDITGITNANPAVVTVASAGTLANGDMIVIQGVSGMTEVNYDGTNVYTVANLVGTSFELSGIDSTGFGVYTSGGTVQHGEVLQLVYS